MLKRKEYLSKLLTSRYIFILIAIFFFTKTLRAQKKHVTLFYFGDSSCGACNRPKFIKSIKKLKAQFDSVHESYDTKFVMVCMDKEIPKGIKFIKKYGVWDEISIGSFYHNELALANLNKTDIPGVPHILIYKEWFKDIGYGVQLMMGKQIMLEKMGGRKIINWVNSGMGIKN